MLRDCLELTPAGPAVPIEEVESAGDIMARFCTGGMSLGAISRETHETIAIAMNRIGGTHGSKFWISLSIFFPSYLVLDLARFGRDDLLWVQYLFGWFSHHFSHQLRFHPRQHVSVWNMNSGAHRKFF